MKKSRNMLPLLAAGSIFLCALFPCGFTRGRVKKGVVINGVSVGGLGYSRAEAQVRARIKETLTPLTVHAPKGSMTVCYPALSFRDNVGELVRSAATGECLTASVERLWTDAESCIGGLCRENAVDATDARVSFTSEGFTYQSGRTGIACDYEKTLTLVLSALRSGQSQVELVRYSYAPALTQEILKERTQLIAQFTTSFDAENADRVHNIRLAAQRVAGTVLAPHETFSFNERVGKRTAEKGYRESAVIHDGAFVKGIGGGVCQLSTTLYNAALLAGLTVTEARPHSLCVSYVPPSLDAMVSDYSDLKFLNPYDLPVYVNAQVENSSVIVRIYGLPNDRTYQTESVVLYRLTPPPELVVEGETEGVLRAEKQGVASESYLLTYDENGALLSRTLLRRDNYAVVQGIRQIKRKQAE